MVVTCDKCRKKYEMRIREQVKNIDGMRITQVYFVCPYCHEKYVIVYKNNKIDVLNKQIKRMLEEAKKENITIEEAERIGMKIRRKQKETKAICASLYLCYHNEFMKEA